MAKTGVHPIGRGREEASIENTPNTGVGVRMVFEFQLSLRLWEGVLEGGLHAATCSAASLQLRNYFEALPVEAFPPPLKQAA